MSIESKYISIWFIVIVFTILIVSRTTTVFAFGAIVNKVKKLSMNVTFQDKTIMSFSGFIRGAISYGLSITI